MANFQPGGFKGARRDFAEEVPKEIAQEQPTLELRLAASVTCVDRLDNGRRKLMLADICLMNAFSMADRLVGESTQVAEFGRASTQATGRPGIHSGEAASGALRARMADVTERAESIEQLQKFRASDERTDVLRSWDLSLKCVAAGTRCWGTPARAADS